MSILTNESVDTLDLYLSTLAKSKRARERNQLLHMCDGGKRQREWVEYFVADGADIREVTNYRATLRGGLRVRSEGVRLCVPHDGGWQVISDLSPAGLRYANFLIQRRDTVPGQDSTPQSTEADHV